MRYQYKNGEKLTRFSIRKYHFGAASVAVASLIFFGGGMSAKAENIPTSENAQITGKSVDSSSSGDKNSKIDDKSTSAQDKSAIVEKTADIVATVKVDKAELKKLTISLDTLFRTTEKDKIASIYDEVSQSISEAKLVLDKDTASAEEVNAQVEKLTEITKKLKETVMKADKTTEKVKEKGRQVGEKKSVDNKVNISGETDKNSESSVSEKKESENQKATAPDKGKLETLAKSIDVYLKSANEITRPETKELLKGVEETVLAVKKGLENPQLTASEIEELVKQGKEAEKKLALAVTRENSGRRDSRNGINIRPESYFRASYYRAADGKVYDSQGDDRLTEATVGYITKANDGSGYPPGTFLYISHNDNASANGRNNADLGPQPVKRLKQKVLAEVTKQSNGYHWRITYNNARESRQNPIYYFTVPEGQSVRNMKLIENGAVVKQGGVAEVFNGASDKYLTSVGTPDAGVHGTPYYENVANTQNGIVGNRGGIYGLDDFVKNNTEVYFNRDGMTEEDKTVTNKLYDKIKSSTQNVFAFRPRDFDRGNTYVVEFDTAGDTEAPLYYIAGMKSYEKIPTGRFMHKSYQQWYGVQERYNITVDTNRLKTTFLKGTGIGTLDTKAGLASSAVTIEDTYTNTRFNPGPGDIGEYNTYKSTGNFSNDYNKRFHNRFVRDFRGGEDGFNMTADRTKGNHTLYIEAVVRNQKINFRLPYKVVTQSDIYQPVAKAATGVKNYTGNLGAASDYITEYRYNSVPGFKEPDSDDMETPNSGLSFYKDRISDFPKTSARIKEQSVKSVEWVGGTNDLTTGTRVIELTVENGRKELFKVPYDIDVVPGGKISEENVAKLNAAIREAYQKVDTNGNVSGTVPTVTSTTPVWVQKQIKVTYYDNENNARTNNQDDSVDYVDVLFKNIRKEATPTAPTISVPEDGSASVTPKGTTDKLVVSYRPTNQNADTTITVKKSGTTWGAVDTLPNGVSVNSSNGVVSITEPTVKDLSTITAKATYLNSDEASATGVAKNPDNVAPTVTLNGTTLTDNASNKTVHVFRGSSLELPLKYYDNATTGRVNISYKNDGGLPQGVWFNDNANASGNYTINQNGKTVNSQGSYTVRGNVSNTASLGERPITLKVSDSADGNVDSGNKKEVKFNVRTYDIEPNSTKVTVEKGTTLSAQDAKAAVTKVNGALDLPEGTTYEWVDANGRNQTVTPNTAGVQNYRVKVTLPSSETGNNAAFRSSKIVNVSVNVRPEAPTITTEEKYKGTLVSTERSISGTGQPRAKVKITLQDGTTVREVTVENNGKWKYNLAPDEKLTQNDKDSTVKASNPISVKQVVNNIESVAKTVDVQMGRAISIATPVKAGRDISVTLPHDTALFYLQIKNGSNTVQYDVQLVDGNWKILNVDKVGTTELKVSNGDNISEKVFTLHIKDSNKKENIPFRINADTTIQVRAHYVNNRNNPANPTNDGGWATASPATNTNPDISVVNQNVTYNSDGTLTKDKLKTLVNVTDAEDDNNKTVGNTARENLDVTVTKNGHPVDLTNGRALKQGTYNLTYTTTDAAGERVTKNHTITVNYIAKAKPTINLIQGENVSDELKRSLLQLQDGTEVVNVPNDAIVEFTNLDINTPSDNKTTQATVVLRNGTRLSPVTLNYNVLKTFKTVEKVYDFKVNDPKKEGRNDTPPSYYTDSNGLPGGMSWVVKRDNEAEFKNADAHMVNMLKADGVGKTTYAFGGKYPRGRFTNNPSETEKLYYTPIFTHEVFDVGANPTKVVANHGTSLNADQAKAAVSLINHSASLPTGTTYEWVKSETDATALTDAEKNVTEFGEITRYVKVTLPKVSETGPNANRVQQYKIIPVTLKVNETVKPTVKLVGEDGREIPLSGGTVNEGLPKVTVYRGEKASVTIKASDNTSKIASLTTSALPNGVAGSGITSSDNATDKSPLIHTLSGIVAKNATVEEKIVTIQATDKNEPANVTTVKFKMVVKEQKEKYEPTKPTTPVNFNNLGSNIPVTDANKITDQVNVTDLSKEAKDAGGVTKTLKDNGAIKTVEGKKVVTVRVTYPDHSIDEVDVPVAQNYNVVARPTINFKQGESLTEEDKRSLVQLQDGVNKVDIPRNATVTFENLDTTMPEDHNKTIDKTAIATITFADNTVKKIPVNYKVLSKFPIANTIYDFKGVARNDTDSDFYRNTGKNIPNNMSWIYKTSDGVEKSARDFREALKTDAAKVGTTTYTYGGKYGYSRFSDSPSNDREKLEHTGTLIHKVFDIQPNTTKVTVTQGTVLTDEFAKNAVANVGNEELPQGTTYEWVGEKVANTSGVQTFQVKVTLPPSQTDNDAPEATKKRPTKTIEVTVNVTPPKPTFDNEPVTSTTRTITGTLGGLNANSSNTVVSVTLNDGTNRVLTSVNNGGVTINGNTWTATIPDDVKLRTSVAKNGETTQPTGLTVTTKIKGATPADDISVVSDTKAVEMGDYSVSPIIAGSKHIDITVPHDAKRVELRFHNNLETGDKPNSIVLVRGTDGWHTEATRTDNTIVTNANGYVGTITSTPSTTNPSEHNIRIALNEQSGMAKLHIKEENANGDNTDSYNKGLGLRVYTQPDAGQTPTATGKWKVAKVTNDKPTLIYKGTEGSNETNRKVFPSGTSITKEMLENLVTVGDREDKVINEADKPYGTPTIKIVSGLKETPGKATPAGRYTVVLKAIDSQGKESDSLTVYVGVVSTDVKYQPKLNGSDLGTAQPITVEGTHQQGDNIPYTPGEVIVDNKVYVPVEATGNSVTLTDKPQVKPVNYKLKDASTDVKYQPKLNGSDLGTAQPITVEGTHQQGDNIPYTPGEVIVDNKVYVPVEATGNSVTLTDKPQVKPVNYKLKDASTDVKYQPKLNGSDLGTAQPITVEGTHQQGDNIPYTPGEVIVDNKVYVPVEATGNSVTLTDKPQVKPVNYKLKDASTDVKYQPKLNGSDLGTAQPITVEGTHQQGDNIPYTPGEVIVDNKVYVPVEATGNSVTLTDKPQVKPVNYKLKDASTDVKYQPKLNGSDLGTAQPITVEGTHQQGDNIPYTPGEVIVDNKVYVPVEATGNSVTLTDKPQVKPVNYKLKDASTDVKYQPKLNGSDLGTAQPITVEGTHQQGDNIPYTPGEVIVDNKVYVPVEATGNSVTLTDKPQVKPVNYKLKDASTDVKYQPKLNGSDLGTAQPITVEGTHQQGDNIPYTPGEVIVDNKVYVPVEATGNSVTLTDKPQVKPVNYKLKDASTDVKYQPKLNGSDLGTAQPITVEGTHQQGDNIPYTPGEVIVDNKVYVPVEATGNSVTLTDKPQVKPVNYKLKDASTDVKYQPKLNGSDLGTAQPITVEGTHQQGDNIPYTPGEVIVDNKVYVPVEATGNSVTLTDKPQVKPVNYKLKDASTDVKYQPKLNGSDLGTAQPITVEGTHQQGDNIPYTPGEVIVDNKVYVPVEATGNSVTLTDKPQVKPVNYKLKDASTDVKYQPKLNGSDLGTAQPITVEGTHQQGDNIPYTPGEVIVDNKVYVPVEATGNSVTLTDKPQVKPVNYKLKDASTDVKYQPKLNGSDLGTAQPITVEGTHQQGDNIPYTPGEVIVDNKVYVPVEATGNSVTLTDKPQVKPVNYKLKDASTDVKYQPKLNGSDLGTAQPITVEGTHQQGDNIPYTPGEVIVDNKVYVPVEATGNSVTLTDKPQVKPVNYKLKDASTDVKYQPKLNGSDLGTAQPITVEGTHQQGDNIPYTPGEVIVDNKVYVPVEATGNSVTLTDKPQVKPVNYKLKDASTDVKYQPKLNGSDLGTAQPITVEGTHQQGDNIPYTPGEVIVDNKVYVPVEATGNSVTLTDKPQVKPVNYKLKDASTDVKYQPKLNGSDLGTAQPITVEGTHQQGDNIPYTPGEVIVDNKVYVPVEATGNSVTLTDKPQVKPVNYKLKDASTDVKYQPKLNGSDLGTAQPITVEGTHQQGDNIPYTPGEVIVDNKVYVPVEATGNSVTLTDKPQVKPVNYKLKDASTDVKYQPKLNGSDLGTAQPITVEGTHQQGDNIPYTPGEVIVDNKVYVPVEATGNSVTLTDKPQVKPVNYKLKDASTDVKYQPKLNGSDLGTAQPITVEGTHQQGDNIPYTPGEVIVDNKVYVPVEATGNSVTLTDKPQVKPVNYKLKDASTDVKYQPKLNGSDLGTAQPITVEGTHQQGDNIPYTPGEVIVDNKVYVPVEATGNSVTLTDKPQVKPVNYKLKDASTDVKYQPKLNGSDLGTAQPITVEGTHQQGDNIPYTPGEVIVDNKVYVPVEATGNSVTLTDKPQVKPVNYKLKDASTDVKYQPKLNGSDLGTAQPITVEGTHQQGDNIPYTPGEVIVDNKVYVPVEATGNSVTLTDKPQVKPVNYKLKDASTDVKYQPKLNGSDLGTAQPITVEGTHQQGDNIPYTPGEVIVDNKVYVPVEATGNSVTLTDKPQVKPVNYKLKDASTDVKYQPKLNGSDLGTAQPITVEGTHQQGDNIPYTPGEVIVDNKVYVPVEATGNSVTLTDKPQVKPVNYKLKDASTDVKYQPKLNGSDLGTAQPITVEGTHQQGDNIPYTPGEVIVDNKVYVPVEATGNSVTLTDKPQVKPVNYKLKDASTDVKYQPKLNGSDLGTAQPITVEGTHQQGDNIPYTPGEVIVDNKVYVPVEATGNSVTLTDKPQVKPVNYKLKDASTDVKYQPKLNGSDLGTAQPITVEGTHQQGDNIPYTPGEVIVDNKVYVPVEATGNSVTLTDKPQVKPVNYKLKDASTDVKYQPKLNGSDLGTAQPITVEGTHQQGDNIPYTPGEVIVDNKVYVPVEATGNSVTLTDKPQVKPVNYKLKDASTDVKYQPKLNGSDLGTAQPITVEGTHQQGDNIPYTPGEVIVDNKVYVPVEATGNSVTLTDKPQVKPVNYKLKDASTDVKYQPKLNGSDLGTAQPITVEGTHQQGDNIPYTPGEVIVDNKVYVPVEATGNSVTLTDKPQVKPVNYKLKDASTDVKYQPKLNGSDLGTAQPITVEGTHQQGDNIPYTPGEVIVDNKVYVPVEATGNSVTLTDKPQVKPVNYKLKDASTDVKYQPKLNGSDLGTAQPITVEGTHQQGDNIPYTPGEVIVDNKVYVPVEATGNSVTLTDKPQVKPVNYKLKDASTDVKYQPKLNGSDLGTAQPITVEGTHQQGDNIPYTPGEVIVDNKVYVPVEATGNSVTLTDKPQVKPVNYKLKDASTDVKYQPKLNGSDLGTAQPITVEGTHQQGDNIPYTPGEVIVDNKVYVPVEATGNSVTLTDKPQVKPVNYKLKDASTDVKYQPKLNGSDLGTAQPITVEGTHQQGDNIPYTPGEVIVDNKVYVPVEATGNSVTLTDKPQVKPVNYKLKDASTDVKYQPKLNGSDLGTAQPITVEGTHQQGDNIPYTPGEVIVDNKVYVPVEATGNSVTLTDKPQVKPVNYKLKDASTDVKYQPKLNGSDLGTAQPITVEGTHQQGDNIPYTPGEVIVDNKVYVPVEATGNSVTLTDKPQVKPVNYKLKDASTDVKYQPKLNGSDLGTAQPITVEGTHQQGDNIPYTPGEVIVDNKVYVPVEATGNSVTLTDKPQVKPVNYKLKDASTDVKYQPKLNGSDLGTAQPITVEGTHQQGDNIPYTPGEVIVDNKVYVPVEATGNSVTLTDKPQVKPVNYKLKDASTDVKYQPKLNGSDLGTAQPITVEGTHQQGDNIPYTPGEVIVDNKVYVPVEATGNSVTLTDKPQVKPVNYKLKDASTDVKYQPKLNGSDLGTAQPITVEGTHQQGDNIPYTPGEVIVDNKVYVPVEATGNSVTLTDKPQVKPVNYKLKDASTDVKYQPKLNGSDLGTAQPITVEGTHQQGDNIPYTPGEVIVDNKVYVPVEATGNSVTLTDKPQVKPVNYKLKDASTDVKYQPKLNGSDLGTAQPITVEGTHQQGDNIPYTPGEVIVDNKVYVPVEATGNSVTLTDKPQVKPVNYKLKDASTDVKYQPKLNGSDLGTAQPITVEGTHQQGDNIPYTPGEVIVDNKVYVPVEATGNSVTLTDKPQVKPVNYKLKDASTDVKYQPKLNGSDLGTAQPITVEGTHQQGDNIPYTPGEVIVDNKVYVPVEATGNSVTLTDKPQVKPVNYKLKDASTDVKYQPKLNGSDLGTAQPITVEGTHQQGDNIPYTPGEVIVDNKVYVPVEATGNSVTLTDKPQVKPVNYKLKDASTDVKYQPKLNGSDLGTAQPITVEGTHQQGDNIPYTPGEVIVDNKVYVPVEATGNSVTLTDKPQVKPVNYKLKDASTDVKYQPKLNGSDLGTAQPITVEGTHQQGDNIPYTPGEVIVDNKVYVPVEATGNSVTLTDKPQVKPVNYKLKDASTDVKYQPKLNGSDLGTAQPITVEGTHQQGDNIPYTPGEVIVDNKVYVPVEATGNSVTLTDKPQVKPVNYKLKDASTDVKYQPKLNGSDLGTAQPITVEGTHQQGDNIPYTPGEVIVDNKVYVPVEATGNSVTLTDKPQTVDVTYKEKPSTSTPTFTVGTQNPQSGNVEVIVDGVLEGTKVKLPGIASEKVVTGGKVELTNNELPENPTTGKGIAQEDGKLPKEGTTDITIPGKLTSTKGEPAREFEVEIPLPLVVSNPEDLTPDEKTELEKKVKKSNPNMDVKVDDKGNVTITDPKTGQSKVIPVKDLTVKDFEPVKPTNKVPVKDKAHLTPEEKKQVADKVKAKNPGKEVTVGDDGTATVTDPTTGISHTIPGTELVNQDFEPVKPTGKVPVKDKAHLTPEEKKQVEDKVKAKNPGKEVTVGDDGTATVTDPTTGISHTIPGTELVNQDFEPVKPTGKVPVKDKAHLTPEEKKQVEDKVKAKNPGKEVTVGDDGTATVTDPTTGISHTIPGTELVNQDFEPVKPTGKVPVKDKAHLTPEEKKQVEDKVKAKNPGKEVTVGDDGTATVTDPTTGISHTIPGTELVNQDFEPVKPTGKVPVKDKAHLTPEEKKQVEDKVKAKNPGKEVTVGDDGTATVTDPTTGISHTIPGTELVNQDFEPVKPTGKVPVKDKAHLTPEEKKQVEDKVKAKNPGKEVTVGDDGTATVTDPTTGISHTIPGTELVNQDFEPVKPTGKVPVKDKAHLTPEEKKQVEDKVKAKNPGKEVTVGDDGTATVTDPTTGISHTIPGTELVNQDFEPVKPTGKVPVKDKAHLTPEEKKQVEDKVKAKNPGKEVTVGDDGTATVTDPTTGISHTIPGTELVNQDFEPVKPTGKVPVKDKAHLTPEEKKQVEDKVKAKNPGKEVTVGDDGTATVTDPTTGISHTIPGTDLVNQDFEPVIPADKIPVKDPANLTQEEQDKVKESVEKSNPGKKVTVDKTGKVTITDPNTNISHEIPGEKLITLDPPVFELPEYTEPIGTTGVDENGNLIEPPVVDIPEYTKPIGTTGVDESGNLLEPPVVDIPEYTEPIGTTGVDENGNLIAPPVIDNPEFNGGVNGEPEVQLELPEINGEVEGEEQGRGNKPQPTDKVEKSTKRLANTGKAETNTGLAGLGLAALGSLLAVAKRRREDEE